LSPHLGIYRWQVSNTLSILHRLTGVGLAAGLLCLVAWLVALASGVEAYAGVAGLLGSPVGLLLLAAFSLAFFYHLCNGIRHLFWDAGRGFERDFARRSGQFTVAIALLLTAALWAVILL
jgi:succinate dehydrogenase / fumarate reductase cytochrome b subunit